MGISGIVSGNNGTSDNIRNINAPEPLVAYLNTEKYIPTYKKMVKSLTGVPGELYVYIPYLTAGSENYSIVCHAERLSSTIDPRGSMFAHIVYSAFSEPANTDLFFDNAFLTGQGYADFVAGQRTDGNFFLENGRTKSLSGKMSTLDLSVKMTLVSRLLKRFASRTGIGQIFLSASATPAEQYSERMMSAFAEVFSCLPYSVRKKVGFVSNSTGISPQNLPSGINVFGINVADNSSMPGRNIIDIDTPTAFFAETKEDYLAKIICEAEPAVRKNMFSKFDEIDKENNDIPDSNQYYNIVKMKEAWRHAEIDSKLVSEWLNGSRVVVSYLSLEISDNINENKSKFDLALTDILNQCNSIQEIIRIKERLSILLTAIDPTTFNNLRHFAAKITDRNDQLHEYAKCAENCGLLVSNGLLSEQDCVQYITNKLLTKNTPDELYAAASEFYSRHLIDDGNIQLAVRKAIEQLLVKSPNNATVYTSNNDGIIARTIRHCIEDYNQQSMNTNIKTILNELHNIKKKLSINPASFYNYSDDILHHLTILNRFSVNANTTVPEIIDIAAEIIIDYSCRNNDYTSITDFFSKLNEFSWNSISMYSSNLHTIPSLTSFCSFVTNVQKSTEQNKKLKDYYSALLDNVGSLNNSRFAQTTSPGTLRQQQRNGPPAVNAAMQDVLYAAINYWVLNSHCTEKDLEKIEEKDKTVYDLFRKILKNPPIKNGTERKSPRGKIILFSALGVAVLMLIAGAVLFFLPNNLNTKKVSAQAQPLYVYAQEHKKEIVKAEYLFSDETKQHLIVKLVKNYTGGGKLDENSIFIISPQNPENIIEYRAQTEYVFLLSKKPEADGCYVIGPMDEYYSSQIDTPNPTADMGNDTYTANQQAAYYLDSIDIGEESTVIVTAQTQPTTTPTQVVTTALPTETSTPSLPTEAPTEILPGETPTDSQPAENYAAAIPAAEDQTPTEPAFDYNAE